MALIRLILYAGGAYFFFLLGFPEWSGTAYHVASLSIILGAAVGVFMFLKVLDWSSKAGKLLIEASFAVGAVLYFGYTMPQKSGKPPLSQWAEGRRPTQSDARDGLTRLGLDANAKPAAWLISLFPKHG